MFIHPRVNAWCSVSDHINIIYLPAYSPDLNPNEKFWANFKRNLRKIAKKYKKAAVVINKGLVLAKSNKDDGLIMSLSNLIVRLPEI